MIILMILNAVGIVDDIQSIRIANENRILDRSTLDLIWILAVLMH